MKSRIRLLRERKRMSQLMLGREIGVSQQIISRIENDISTLSVSYTHLTLPTNSLV